MTQHVLGRTHPPGPGWARVKRGIVSAGGRGHDGKDPPARSWKERGKKPTDHWPGLGSFSLKSGRDELASCGWWS